MSFSPSIFFGINKKSRSEKYFSSISCAVLDEVGNYKSLLAISFCVSALFAITIRFIFHLLFMHSAVPNEMGVRSRSNRCQNPNIFSFPNFFLFGWHQRGERENGIGNPFCGPVNSFVRPSLWGRQYRCLLNGPVLSQFRRRRF